MYICFGYGTLIIFLSLFLLCDLVFFWHEMLSRRIDSGYLVAATPLTVPIVLNFETLHMFSARNEDFHVVLV